MSDAQVGAIVELHRMNALEQMCGEEQRFSSGASPDVRWCTALRAESLISWQRIWMWHLEAGKYHGGNGRGATLQGSFILPAGDRQTFLPCPSHPPTHPHTHTHIYIHPHTPPPYLRRHFVDIFAFTGKNQISSSVSHYVIHLSARREWRPQQENNDQPRIFIKAGLDFSFLFWPTVW